MNVKGMSFIAVLVALFVVACGGGGASGDEPVGAVQNLMESVQEMNLDQAKEYLCQEQRSAFEEEIEGGFAELEELGMDRDELLDAFNIELANMKYTEVSRSENQAVVGITGDMSLTFDEEKLREFVRKAAEAEGQEVSDEQLDFVVSMLVSAGGEETPIDDEIEVVQEDGEWLVCSEMNFLDQGQLLNLPGE